MSAKAPMDPNHVTTVSRYFYSFLIKEPLVHWGRQMCLRSYAGGKPEHWSLVVTGSPNWEASQRWD